MRDSITPPEILDRVLRSAVQIEIEDTVVDIPARLVKGFGFGRTNRMSITFHVPENEEDHKYLRALSDKHANHTINIRFFADEENVGGFSCTGTRFESFDVSELRWGDDERGIPTEIRMTFQYKRKNLL